MKEVIRLLRKYFKNNDLKPNIGKTKIVTFSRGGRTSKETWHWDAEKKNTIEEVKTFKYLGFSFQSNGRHTTHIDKICKDGTRRLGETFRSAQMNFPDNYLIRMQMFDILVMPTLIYGCEIFGQETRTKNWKKYTENISNGL